MDREADAIETATELQRSEFADLVKDASEVKSIKVKGGHCYFYNRTNGHCNIYDHRPFDCRMFPFDIIKHHNGDFFWILYVELCPIKFRIENVCNRYFMGAKRLFARLNMSPLTLERFATQSSEIMKRHKYKILEEVRFNSL